MKTTNCRRQVKRFGIKTYYLALPSKTDPKTILVATPGGELLLGFHGWRPRVLLNIFQSTAQPPPQNHPVQNVTVLRLRNSDLEDRPTGVSRALKLGVELHYFCQNTMGNGKYMRWFHRGEIWGDPAPVLRPGEFYTWDRWVSECTREVNIS